MNKIKEKKEIDRNGFWTNKLAILRKSEFVIPLTILFGIFLLLLVSAYENNSDNSGINDTINNSSIELNQTMGDNNLTLNSTGDNQTIGDNNSGARKSVSDEVQTAKLNYDIQDSGVQTFYWVGVNNGNWSNSSNWATSSGGAGGAGVPNATVAVVFDYGTSNSAVIDRDFSIAGFVSTIDYYGTIRFIQNVSANLNISGNFVLGIHSTMSIPYASLMGNGTGRIITVGGNATISGSVTGTGAGFPGYAAGLGAGPGATQGSGGPASHGSKGGAWGADSGPVYGSLSEPMELGSGGMGLGNSEGYGGGALKLNVTGMLTVSGTINMDSSSGCLGGSGGSVWLIANSFAGAGTISASAGGAGCGGGLGGGGGRIAIYYSNSSFSGTINVARTGYASGTLWEPNKFSNTQTAFFIGSATYYYPNRSNVYGGNLTVNSSSNVYILNMTLNISHLDVSGSSALRFDSNETGSTDVLGLNNYTLNGDVIIGTGSSAIIDEGNHTFNNLTLTGTLNFYSTAYIPSSFNLTLLSGAVLWLPAGTYGFNGLTVPSGATVYTRGDTTAINAEAGGTVDNPYGIGVTLNINGNASVAGSINGVGLGFNRLRGPGRGSWTSTHGGKGAGSGTATYGSLAAPTELGSGSNYAGSLNSGGSAVKINATDTIVINGTITEDGYATGDLGGSGGSVWLISNRFAGNGTISARGSSPTASYAGGGGRVALDYNVSTFNGLIDINGGYYGAQAQPGTLWDPKKFNSSGNQVISGGFNYIFPNRSVINVWNLTVNNSANVYFSNCTMNISNLNIQGAYSSLRFDIDKDGNTGLYGLSNFTVTDSITIGNSLASFSVYEGNHTFNNLTLTGTLNFYSTAYIPSSFNLTLLSGAVLWLPAGTYGFNGLTVPSGATVYTRGNYTEINPEAGGTVGNPYGIGVKINVNGNASVAGSINGVGQGFRVLCGGPGAGGSASHGGRGASWGGPGKVYGSLVKPTELGSGSNWCGNVYGGGAVKLNATDTLNVSGTIDMSATGNGVPGAGGSVWLISNRFVGAGAVSAKGATGDHWSYSGGGGRVAIEYTNTSFSGQTDVSGGWSSYESSPGTVFLCSSPLNGACSAGYNGINWTSLFAVNSTVNVTRQIINFSSTDMKWIDSSTNQTNRGTYNFSGLIPSNNYYLYINGSFNGNLTADTQGNLAFSVYLNQSSTGGIEILDTPPTASAIYPNSSWVNASSSNFTANLTDNSGVANATLNIEHQGNYWLSFDGVNDYVNITNSSSSLELNSTGTISLWFNAKATQVAYSTILCKRTNSASACPYDLDLFSSGDRIRFYLAKGAVYNPVFGGTISYNAWTYVTGTWNGSSLSIYVNGVLTNTTAQTTNAQMNTGELNIGDYQDFGGSHGGYFNGSIDEVRIYNRSLSANEISQLYRNALKSSPSLLNDSLVAYYNFNEGSGTNLIDRTNGVNNGTISGATWSNTETTTVNFATGVVNTIIGVVTNLVDGVYKWWWNVFDRVGSLAQTGNVTLTVDTLKPLLNYSGPTPENNSGVSSGFGANVSITELNLKNVSWVFNGTSYTYGSNYSLMSPANLTSGLVLLMNFDSETNYSVSELNSSESLAQGLVGLWHLNEASGNAMDSSGNGNNGNVVAGVTQGSAGIFNKSYTFDVSGGYVNATNSSVLDLNNTFTISSWVKTSSTGRMTIVAKTTPSSPWSGYELSVGQGTAGKLSLWTGQGSFSGLSTTAVNDNNWHHIVVTFNSGSVAFYKDGQPDGNSSVGAPIKSSVNLRIGLTNYDGFPFSGNMDELAIWNRSLSASEIGALYNKGATMIYDSSGRNYSGVIQGAVVNSSGKYGSALSFNRTSYVSGNLFNTSSSNPITVSAWLKLNSLTGTWQIPFRWGNELSNQILDIAYGATSGTAQTLTCDDWLGGSTPYAANVDLNQWVHIVCVYNGSSLVQYINGVYNGTWATSIALTNSSYYIGGRAGVYGFNGSVDELSIWNRSLSLNEVAQLYQSQLVKHGDETYLNYIPDTTLNTMMQIRGLNGDGINSDNWNIFVNQSGLGVGTAPSYYLVARDMAGNINNSEIRTIRGNTLPVLRSIVLSPNDTDSVDPSGVLSVRVNVTDSTSNFDSAILQWKNSTATDWNNISLINVSGGSSAMILNASWALPSYEDNLTYRVWMKDTVESANSSAYILPSFWDCSWIATEDLGATAGWNQNKNVGNLIINNTGDAQYANNNCTLSYRVSYDLPEGRVYVDGVYLKPSNVYTINAKSIQNISINATFLNELTQEVGFLTVSEVYGRSTNTSKRTSLTLVSNQNGPYLYEKITAAPGSVSLTDGGFSIQGYVRNIMGSAIANENNTAYNVSFYWTLPNGMVNSSGELSLEYSNLTDNGFNYIDTNVSVESLASMTPGVKTFYLNAYGYDLSNNIINHVGNVTILNEQINISFVCYGVSDGVYVTACGSADGDYVAPTISETVTDSSGGGGGGGGAGAGGGGGSKFITESSRFELTRGKQNSFTVEFRNPFAVGEIKDLRINLTGLLSEYITVSPSSLDSLAAGETLKITSEITAPKYFNEGKYNLTMIITGTQTANQSTSEVNERKVITLYIFDISSAEGLKYMDNSAKYLADMKSRNWSVREIEGLLNDIRTAYNSTSLDIVNAKYNQLKSLYDKAIQSDLLIKALREEMNNSKLDGVSTPETNKLVNLAESAFLRGDYNLAMDRLKEAQLSFALETKGEFSLVYYVKRHPTNTAGIVLATLVFVTGTSLLVRKRLLKSKLKLLGEEETLLLGLMKVVQKQCFEDAKMSMDEYQNAMAQYESRLNSVIQDKIETQSRLLNLMRIRGGRKKALNEESARLKDLIRETQKMYFEQNKIETRVYNNMMKSYAAKLSEIEEKLATLEAREALSKAGFRGGIKI